MAANFGDRVPAASAVFAVCDERDLLEPADERAHAICELMHMHNRQGACDMSAYEGFILRFCGVTLLTVSSTIFCLLALLQEWQPSLTLNVPFVSVLYTSFICAGVACWALGERAK